MGKIIFRFEGEKLIEISVIIPMYNAQNTIVKAIESVFNQKCNYNIEIIVINDGSFDESLNVLQNYLSNHEKSDNVRVISKENGGVSSARNEGLKIAKGKFVAFLDSDDQWLEEKLDKQIKLFKISPEIALIGTTINGKIYKRFFLKKFKDVTEIKLLDLIFRNYFQPSTVIIRKEVVEDIGCFDENQRYAEEGNYFYRIANKYKCLLINESLLNFGDGKNGFGESGLSGNIKEMEKGELKNLSFAYRNGYIGITIYIIAVAYSLIKYLRRVVIKKIIKRNR